MNGCIKPPHFPPHCGCPAGVAPCPAGTHAPTPETTEEGK